MQKTGLPENFISTGLILIPLFKVPHFDIFIFTFSWIETKLQDEGSVFNPYEALDEVGTVYMRIPANKQGTGKIQIKLQGSIKEIEAVTAESATIPTGTSIRVVDHLTEQVAN